MFTIYIGSAIIVILFILAKITEEADFAIIGIICFIVAFIIAFLPGGGREYGEWKMVEETELVPIYTETISGDKHDIYLVYSEEDKYTYRYRVESEVSTSTPVLCETETLSNKNVEEIEDKNCKTPVLQVYEREGLEPKWRVIRLPAQTKYVFYYPEGGFSVS